jgi:hypothetical protein
VVDLYAQAGVFVRNGVGEEQSRLEFLPHLIGHRAFLRLLVRRRRSPRREYRLCRG